MRAMLYHCFFLIFLQVSWGVGAPVSVEQLLVDALNLRYQSYNPEDDSSPLGVMITGFDGGAGEEPYLADCKNCGNVYGIPLKTSNCKMSTSILNSKNSHLQKDWLAKRLDELPRLFPFDCEITGSCGIELGIYPTGKLSPLKGEFSPFYDSGGAIYAPAVEQTMKCSYAFDGTTQARPNRGCACTSGISTICPRGNKNWPCPTTLNTCSNKDPLSDGPINANSSVLTACQCSRMGITEKDDPLWSGITYPLKLPKCMWLGPQFYDGKGKNELRHTLRQQYNFKKEAVMVWNEVVLDGEAYNDMVASKPWETITAFWYPRHKHCGKVCQDSIYRARDNFEKHHGVQHVPVIMIDVYNGSAPFVVAPQKSREAGLTSNPLEPQVTVV